MRKNILLLLTICVALVGCRNAQYRLQGSLGSDYDGKVVVLTNYSDSTPIDSVKMQQGQFLFEGEVSMPQMAMLTVDGKVRAYLVLEDGDITLAEGEDFAGGTQYNDSLKNAIPRMDKAEEEGMDTYLPLIGALYQQYKDTPLGIYFAVEKSRYDSAEDIDKMLSTATDEVKQCGRIARYRKAADLRKATAPGQKFTDFTITDPEGKQVRLSDYAGKGKYVLVDFWASWCPYCIKELPTLKEIYGRYDRSKLEILGVAVRDKAEDTKAAVQQYGITWPIMYNAERIPYDIYGFTGIPHLMLLSPDGTIVARGETANETAKRLEQLMNN